MKIEIFEAATAILYHATTIHAAASILKNKEFSLTAAVGTDSERAHSKGSRFYYLSTARGKTADYTIHNIYNTGVVFNLNGDWFNSRYKTAPIDYWEGWWIKQREAGSKDRGREQEDRVFSYDSEIKLPTPMTDLISEIHVLITMDVLEKDDRFQVALRQLIISSKQNDIPVYVYNDKKDMILQNKSKTMDMKELVPLLKDKSDRKPWPRMKRDWLKIWRELYYQDDRNNLSSYASRKAYDLMYGGGFRQEEMVTGLSADIHNSRKNVEEKEDLKKLLDIFRKEKITSPKEYIELLAKKWAAKRPD